MLGQVGHMITQLADTAMVGKYLGETPLAAVSLASSVFVLYLVLIIGLATGITTKVGNYHGEKNNEGIARATASGLITMIICVVPLAIFAWATNGVLAHLDWPPEVVQMAIPYYKVLCWSMLPLGIFMAFKHFIDGLEITIPAMVVSIVANLVNVALNYALIEGNWGFEAYGLLGAGYATFIARMVMVVLIVAVILYNKTFRSHCHYILKLGWFPKQIKEIIKLGFPIGLQYLMEGGAFVIGAIMVGWLGKTNASAHHIALQISSFTFMFASGLGSAATIRISNLLGAKKHNQIGVAVRSLYFMIIALQLVFALSIYGFNKQLPELFINEAEVLKIAAVLLLMAALFQVMDGIQLVAAGILRGASDVKIPTFIAGISYWLLAIPIGYLLQQHTNLGPLGVWVGFTVGLSFAAVFLSFRVRKVL